MPNLKDIPPGKGKVIEVDGKKIAVFNDNGALKTLSTVCPHLQCDVDWNDKDNTWDCPCHGSRFEADGSLKKGPAERGLDTVDIKLE